MQDLKQLRRWMAFELTPQLNGTVKKRPVNLASGGGASCASCSDPSTWVDYQTARDAVFANPNYSLGFVLGKEVGLVVVDIDKARPSKDAPWPAWVEKEVEQLDSFDEVSVSGLGRHVWVWGSIPANLNRQSHHVEIHDSAKMFCVSPEFAEAGDKIKQRDLGILWKRIDDGRIGPDHNPGIVLHAYKSQKFERATNDDLSDFDGDRSRAVSSVLWTLARKHNFDADAMRKEFEATKLCANMKPGKWERVGDAEIERAITEVKKLEPATPLSERLSFNLPAPPKASKREYVLHAKPDVRFSGWFPRGAVSIIGGSSNAGKTTLVLDLLTTQKRGESFLGRQGGRLPFLWLSADRGREDNLETLERLDLLDESGESSIPLDYIYAGAQGNAAVTQILTKVEKHGAPPVVFIEGADGLVEDPNKAQVVAPFLTLLRHIAEHYRIAIILSVGAPKSKPGEAHTLKRDRVFGSQIWTRMTSTVLTLAYVGDGTEAQRELDVSYKNAKPETFPLEFNAKGRLVPRIEEPEKDPLELWARDQEWFTASEAIDGMSKDGADAGMSRSNVNRQLKAMTLSGKLLMKYDLDGARKKCLYRVPNRPGDTTGDVFGQATGS